MKDNNRCIGAEIVLIGDRICGKTTYLASLVRNPNHDHTHSPIKNIQVLKVMYRREIC